MFSKGGKQGRGRGKIERVGQGRGTYVQLVWEKRHVDQRDGSGSERDVMVRDVVRDRVGGGRAGHGRRGGGAVGRGLGRGGHRFRRVGRDAVEDLNKEDTRVSL